MCGTREFVHFDPGSGCNPAFFLTDRGVWDVVSPGLLEMDCALSGPVGLHANITEAAVLVTCFSMSLDHPYLNSSANLALVSCL